MTVYRMRMCWVVLAVGLCLCRQSSSQTFGVELHNTLMPASGAMAGVSIARPQDLTSAINANPASLVQFRGTQFLFGGAWSEPTFNLTQTSSIPALSPEPRIEPFSAKSAAPGIPAGNIGLTQDLEELGLPATLGIGFLTTAGGFIDFRHVPESGGTNSGQAIFSLPVALGVELTDRLSLGASMALGIAFFDGPFVEFGGMTPGYALRGTVGANYRVDPFTTLGAYYQTAQSFTFRNAFLVQSTPGELATDVNMQLPQNIGVGFANNELLNGSLLIGVDVLYKLWDEADLYRAVYDNQLVVQFGSQLSRGRYRFRAGYAWAENPLAEDPGLNLGGVIQPGGIPAVRYSQGLLAVTSQHRMSLGIGVVDALPGIDFDLLGGGMFPDEQQIGDFTTTSIESYWLGFGMTWRFNRGSCSANVPDHWGSY
jgi:long-chain fatty acid transport protein